MNERIKELAGQAGFKPYYDIGTGEVDPDGQAVTLPNWSTTDPWISMVQKFAELIVKECAELIDNKVTITAAQTYDEVFVAKYDTKELCAQQIKEHFGVE